MGEPAKRMRFSSGSETMKVLARHGSFLRCLMEGDSCSLITQKQLFDFVRGVNRDGSGKQMFALANIASEHGFEDRACLYRNRRNS